MIAIDGGSRGVTANDTVRVTVTVDARVQQVDIHQILRIGDGVQAGSGLSLGDILVGNTLRGHDAGIDGTALVVSAYRPEPCPRRSERP